jgi:hypothetical protein
MFDIIVVRELTLSALDFVTNGINTKLYANASRESKN